MDEVFDIVDLVLYFLALLSVIVWAVTIAKAFMFFRMGKQNKKFMRAFAEIKHLRGLTAVAKSTKGHWHCHGGAGGIGLQLFPAQSESRQGTDGEFRLGLSVSEPEIRARE